MKKYNQTTDTDCMRACIATVLQINPKKLPNPQGTYWQVDWQDALDPIGVYMVEEDPHQFWEGLWIARVASKNLDGRDHAIVMSGKGFVFHDPSNKNKYSSYLARDEILKGFTFRLQDASLLKKAQRAFIERMRSCLNPYQMSWRSLENS